MSNYKIEYLYHFTHKDNLPSIMLNGLLPRSELENRGLLNEYNDDDRYDGKEAICFSVNQINQKLYSVVKKRQTLNDSDFICIKIKYNEIVGQYKYNSNFSIGNATAKKATFTNESDDLFMNKKYTSLTNKPLDIQSEFRVFKKIDFKFCEIIEDVEEELDILEESELNYNKTYNFYLDNLEKYKFTILKNNYFNLSLDESLITNIQNFILKGFCREIFEHSCEIEFLSIFLLEHLKYAKKKIYEYGNYVPNEFCLYLPEEFYLNRFLVFDFLEKIFNLFISGCGGKKEFSELKQSIEELKTIEIKKGNDNEFIIKEYENYNQVKIKIKVNFKKESANCEKTNLLIFNTKTRLNYLKESNAFNNATLEQKFIFMGLYLNDNIEIYSKHLNNFLENSKKLYQSNNVKGYNINEYFLKKIIIKCFDKYCDGKRIENLANLNYKNHNTGSSELLENLLILNILRRVKIDKKN